MQQRRARMIETKQYTWFHSTRQEGGSKKCLGVWGRLMKKSWRFQKRDLWKLDELLSTGQQMTKPREWEMKTRKLRSFYKFKSHFLIHFSHGTLAIGMIPKQMTLTWKLIYRKKADIHPTWNRSANVDKQQISIKASLWHRKWKSLKPYLQILN